MTAATDARPLFRRTWPWLVLIALVHLVIAWPGAATRGINSEEVEPYLRHYPKLVDVSRDRVVYVAPNDDPELLRAVEHGEPVRPRAVATTQWPEVAYHGRDRVFPLFVRGHQTALGTWWGILLGPLLGGGIAGVRRSHVLFELILLGATWGFARRSGMSRPWSAVALLGCVFSPGLWWFCRTGYGFELASRIFMMLTLWVAAKRTPLTHARGLAIGVFAGLAILSRATIAATLAPLVLLVLADRRRWRSAAPALSSMAMSAAIPLIVVGLAMWRIRFAEAPGEHLALDQLATRTLRAPAVAVIQLAWVVDPRVVLGPLVRGETSPEMNPIRPLLGAVVAIAAMYRWWHARATEGERLFVAGILGNALTSAWLYGNPIQFQLGMALEPIFVLAVVAQLAALTERSKQSGAALTALVLLLRVGTTVSLYRDESRSDNPMLSYGAQQLVLQSIRRDHIASDDFLTTTYEHVGVWESWSGEAVRPVHLWRMLKATGVSQDVLVTNWQLALDRFPACHVLLTRAPNLVAGRFANNERVVHAFDAAIASRGVRIVGRESFPGEGGRTVFELITLSPCGVTP